MGGRNRFPSGYFLVRDGEKNYFMKITASRHAPRIRDADRMAAFVKEHGVGVSCLLPGFPRLADDRHTLFAYPYVDGGFSYGEPRQLASLGRALAQLHRALRRCPWRQRVRRHGMARHRMLLNRLQLIQRGHHGNIPAAALSLLERVSGDRMEILYPNAQVIHGDLNAGNILFSHRNGHPVFLDFEDSLTAWFSPLTDLAYLLERFALTGSSALPATELILRNYYRGGGVRFESVDQLNWILQALAIRALLLLAEKTGRQNEAPPATGEWEKFITLYHAATRQDGQMAALIDRLRRT